MPKIQVLKDPGYIYDLNYLFYLHFNKQLCLGQEENVRIKEANEKYINELLAHFGDISDDLYVFYHANPNGRSLMTTSYLDPYKDRFAIDYNFQFLKKLLLDVDSMIRNVIRFYLPELSATEMEACVASNTKLYARIKASQYSYEEKSRLYEFFHNPLAYIQALQCALIEKEQLLSVYYKENYEKLIEAHNQTTFETLCENVKGIDNLSFLNKDEQVMYTSYCLLHRSAMVLYFTMESAVYLLGYDYLTTIRQILKAPPKPALDSLCAALSEVSRLQILHMLLEKPEITCKELERVFSFSGSTAYHHLSILTKSGALKLRNEGKIIYYSLNRPFFDCIIDQLKIFSNQASKREEVFP